MNRKTITAWEKTVMVGRFRDGNYRERSYHNISFYSSRRLAQAVHASQRTNQNVYLRPFMAGCAGYVYMEWDKLEEPSND